MGAPLTRMHVLGTPVIFAAHQLPQTGFAIVRRLPRKWLGTGNSMVEYPVCRLSWGSEDSTFSSLDLAALSAMTYEPDCAAMANVLQQSFGLVHPAPRIEHCTPYENLPRFVTFYFPPRRWGAGGTRVFAVKGTSTWRDIYADMKIFATIHMLQVFSKLVPIFDVLPLPLIQKIVGNSESAKHIWEELEDGIKSWNSTNPLDKVVLTGHSLGGGIAQVVAAKLRLPALLFSAPGVLYSAQRFGIVPGAARHVVNVLPEGDMVPRVDDHTGVVQHIPCRAPGGRTQLSAGACHSLTRTSCELWRSCGDPAGRDWSTACSPHVAVETLGDALFAL